MVPIYFFRHKYIMQWYQYIFSGINILCNGTNRFIKTNINWMTILSHIVPDTFSCIIHERLLCLLIVCETMFTIGESRTNSHPTQNCKLSKCLQILAEEDFPLKLLLRTPIKIYRRADRRRQPRTAKQRTSLSTAKATSSTQRPILQVHCKRIRWREGTPTADASKSDKTGSGKA